MASRKLVSLPYPKILSRSLEPLWYRPEQPCLPFPCPPPYEPHVLAPPSSLPPPLVLAPPLPPGLPFLFPVLPPPPSSSHHMSPWLVVALVLLGLLLLVVASATAIRYCLRAKRQREEAAAAEEEAMQQSTNVSGELRRSELRSAPPPYPRQSIRAGTRGSLKNYMQIVLALGD
ncbi:proline-rich receptor-like protein kinase PERK2 [Rhodamnia argentea]|uniref:Proline-rich receptor-like protein kinase PERK2 n=1 Tax=Rhodamnia argentea TaxID=178133 RepID=A0ABM3GZX2_9MYRT|nr:proline-rich receptor-like protein kinase PERK2 [Rhodamnia argentea]